MKILARRTKTYNNVILSGFSFVFETDQDPETLPCPYSFSNTGIEQELEVNSGYTPARDHDMLIIETWYSDPMHLKEIKSTVIDFWELFDETLMKRFKMENGLVHVHVTKTYSDNTNVPVRKFEMLLAPKDFKSMIDHNRYIYEREKHDGKEIPNATYHQNRLNSSAETKLCEKWFSDPDNQTPDIEWTV